ncbi:MAG: MBL fold metallo-hydrolase [Anaerolineae bacterium]
MLFERIESTGLAHYSYLVGHNGEAAVIDPRRDCSVYVDRATRQGVRIRYVLETHRNEDYLVGSRELAARTGAEIWHADAQWDYRYGEPVQDGQAWEFGGLRLQAIHTPGHTPGAMTYLLYDPDDIPWVLFTGDTLFAGQVGRVDLLGEERMEEMAALLHASLFDKLLRYADGVIVCPAHGAGSVCGESGMANRPFTTIGIERATNPTLQHTQRDSFVAQAAVAMEHPPYFQRMEALNVEGPPALGFVPLPIPLQPEEFSNRAAGALVLDTRLPQDYGSGHIPGSLSIWEGGLARFAGWHIEYDCPVYLVTADDDPTVSVLPLLRMGYDDVVGYLAGGIMAWHEAGLDSGWLETITVHELCEWISAKQEVWILDVRREDELQTDGRIPHAHHIPMAELAENMNEVPKDRRVAVFCGSGRRSMVAASLLRRAGWVDLAVVLGGFRAWDQVSCPELVHRAGEPVS